ncbi:MAG: methylated-DNA--[protein]-cysteine S-methyltransferase [Fermentimonas sp.]|nr:methylated-DNA--[protein]-cysteine S-methyltransferase [Fermentimonas sp.]
MSKQAKINRYNIIPMTQFEENDLTINYDSYDSIYGNLYIASTDKGICYIGLGNETEIIEELKKKYTNAVLVKKADQQHSTALSHISNPDSAEEINFHIKGTDFQLEVWNELLNTECGKTCSYKHIAEKIGKPKAVRAVATAIGQNPVTFLIPCHRIIRFDGTLGGYYWGLDIKKKILKHESLR